LNKSILVIDIGGGSTELILGSNGKIEKLKSLDVGCLRMKEQFLKSDPPKESEIKQLLEALDELFKDDILEYKNKFQIAIAVAGTSTSLAAVKLGLKKYDRMKIHRTDLSLSDVEELNGWLSSVNLTEREKILSMEPERADVIVAGGLILEYLMKKLSINKMIVFESDILDGLALSLAQ
jgi:exopolyphosphatase/guanosine-5'-triphosphate,3'-diphosphate pyrophosphatase